MAPKNKLESHPHRELITQWLLTGVSVRDVEHRITQLYPGQNQHHLRLSASTIQNFRKYHLQLEDEVLSDIKEVEAQTKAVMKQEAVHAEVVKSSAYREKLNQIVDEKLETQREIVKVFTLIENRIEALYNKLTATDEIAGFTDIKLEAIFIKYLEQFMKAIEQHKKYIENYRDSTDVNVNVNIASSQVGTIREAVREVLADLDPQIAIRFMEKLNVKMKSLEHIDSDIEGVLVSTNTRRGAPSVSLDIGVQNE